VTNVEDDMERQRCKALARKLGGHREALFFRAP